MRLFVVNRAAAQDHRPVAVKAEFELLVDRGAQHATARIVGMPAGPIEEPRLVFAPHDLAILDFILPETCVPTAVAAHGADPIGAGRMCIGYLTLFLSGDAIAHCHVNWLSPTKIRTTIIGGSKRMVVWDDANPVQRLSLYDKGVEIGSGLQHEMRREALISYRIGDMVAPVLPEQEALQAVVVELVLSQLS